MLLKYKKQYLAYGEHPGSLIFEQCVQKLVLKLVPN